MFSKILRSLDNPEKLSSGLPSFRQSFRFALTDCFVASCYFAALTRLACAILTVSQPSKLCITVWREIGADGLKSVPALVILTVGKQVGQHACAAAVGLCKSSALDTKSQQ